MKKSIAVIFMILAVPSFTWAKAEGQGKTKGNSCMSQCIGIYAKSCDTFKELSQYCQKECNIGTGQGSCSTSEDNCCVPYTNDLDCVKKCFNNIECETDEFCSTMTGECGTNGICITRPDFCDEMWDPVCGCDGVSYYNECYATSAGVSVDYFGECIN